MTQIHISIRKPKTGGLDPVTGTLRFRPVRRHFDAAKNLIIAASFDANLSETGELTVDLLPTTSAFVWQVIELADTPQAYTRYVEVPDSKTKVEYADLVEVDAGTFVPKDMQGSQLLKVRHASTQSEAETLSARYPDAVVLFDETATTMKAAMAMSTLESITAEAQTNAALASPPRIPRPPPSPIWMSSRRTPVWRRLPSPTIRRPWPTPLPWSRRRARRPSPPSIRRCRRSRTRPRALPPNCLPPAPLKAPRRKPARTPPGKRQPEP